MHDIVYDCFWDSQWALAEAWEKQVPTRVSVVEYPGLNNASSLCGIVRQAGRLDVRLFEMHVGQWA